MFGAIELGGTKVIAAVARGENELLEKIRIKTVDPETVVGALIDFFDQQQNKMASQIQSIGIASFGPIEVNQQSARFGTFYATPKQGWSDYPLVSKLKTAFDVPYRLETDVSGALLGEHKMGAAQDVQNAVYVTIGTGIGAGIMVNGELVQGQMHPEVGHMIIPTKREQGNCPFHRDCLEGLASGPAIALHAGAPAQDLPLAHPIWEEVSDALAVMCHNLLMMLSTQRIILGGGVMANPELINAVRQKTLMRLEGYLPTLKNKDEINNVIVSPGIESDSGLIGATILARQAI